MSESYLNMPIYESKLGKFNLRLFMKKVVFILFLMSQSVFALSATYHGEKYALCTSEQYLDDWTGFINDKDKSSITSYFGSKCIMLKNSVSVSSIDTHMLSGTVSFFYKGHKFWGYMEGIER